MDKALVLINQVDEFRFFGYGQDLSELIELVEDIERKLQLENDNRIGLTIPKGDGSRRKLLYWIFLIEIEQVVQNFRKVFGFAAFARRFQV